jgi:hypothetical protein
MDKRMKCNRAVAVACGLLMITCGRASCTPKPVYGTWGLDFAGEDRVTKPGDDFFRFANGAWLDRTQIPADKSAVGSAWTMSDLAEARLHDMMEQFAAKATHQPSDLEGKVGAFYSHSWTKRVSSNWVQNPSRPRSIKCLSVECPKRASHEIVSAGWNWNQN